MVRWAPPVVLDAPDTPSHYVMQFNIVSGVQSLHFSTRNSTVFSAEWKLCTFPQGTAQCSVLSGNYALFHKELHQVHHPPNLRQEAADSAVQFWSDGPPIQLIFMICTSSHLLIGKPRFLRRTLYIGHCRLGVGWGVKSQFGQCPNVGCFIENGASLAYPSPKINPSFGCWSA